MFDPVVHRGFGDMKQRAHFRHFVQRLVGEAGRFVTGDHRSAFFIVCKFLADNLPDNLPELFRGKREQHGGNGVTIAHIFFHHFSF